MRPSLSKSRAAPSTNPARSSTGYCIFSSACLTTPRLERGTRNTPSRTAPDVSWDTTLLRASLRVTSPSVVSRSRKSSSPGMSWILPKRDR